MTIKYNVSGKERKRMALAIAKWLGEEVKYKGVPSFAYEVDCFTIDKDGNLIFDDQADSTVIVRLLEHLYDEGFESDMSIEELKEVAEKRAKEVREVAEKRAKEVRHKRRNNFILIISIRILLVALSIFLTYLAVAVNEFFIMLAAPIDYITFQLRLPQHKRETFMYIVMYISLVVPILLGICGVPAIGKIVLWGGMFLLTMLIHVLAKTPIDGYLSNTPKQKDASVVGRGIVGYLIAGPAAGIIGAISAADKITETRKTNS